MTQADYFYDMLGPDLRSKLGVPPRRNQIGCKVYFDGVLMGKDGETPDTHSVSDPNSWRYKTIER